MVAEGLHCLAPVTGLGDHAAGVLKEEAQDLTVELVVLGHQHVHVRKIDAAGLVAAGRLTRLGHGKAQLKVEEAPLPRLALQTNAAAHHVHQAVADRQPQARTLLVSRLRVQALETLKNTFLIGKGNTHTLVAHAKEHTRLTVCNLKLAHLKAHGGPRRRVLDRVAQEVDQHLVDTQSVAVQPVVLK